jgi:hypothetical protein
MLIEFARRGIRPDLILFADTGGEKPQTYQYLGVIRPFLRHVGFPDVVVVRYRPKRAAYHTLEGDAGEEHRLTWARPVPGAGQRPSREAWLNQHYFVYWYPLLEWGYDRNRCKQVIADAGLPVPIKSACFYCPASKKQEIVRLRQHHPELLERALRIERNARAKLTSVKGLGRSFSWESFLRRCDDLPLFGGCDA